ncbi:methyltransferase domain-containing protein [Candidatus Bathyarchaeota archaeon]|nr:methyltransferase domain-containing protein [Candidatus Bathyarchaeota archaeon]
MPTWNEKRRVKKCYDLTSNIYNIRYSEEQKNKYKRALLNVNFNQKSIVLDIGCGSGLLFSYLTSKVDTIIGIDLSIGLLHKAKENNKETNIHLILADADNLPLQTNKVNIVFAFTMLQNMPSPLMTLKEIILAAKTDGQIIVTGLKKVFSLEKFKELLEKSGLKIVAIENGSDLKCYVAITKSLVNSKGFIK